LGNTGADTVTLGGGAVTLQTTGTTKTMTVAGTLDGPQNLTLDTTGVTNFNAAVGSLAPIGNATGAAITITSAGATNFNSTLATKSGLTQADTAGDVTFKNNVTVAAGDTATTLNGNVVLTGPLTFTSAGNVSLGNTGADTVTLGGGAVTLRTTGTTKTLTVAGTLDGSQNLTLDTTGVTNFNAPVGS